MVKKLEGAGLRGQVAGETSLSRVGQIECRYDFISINCI